jgi:cytochrome c biogenesis protein CcmG/thiol:disulfide interchange protein DsbE
MQRRNFLTLVLMTLVLVGLPAQHALAGDAPPDFTLPTLDGGTVQLSQHKGEVVYVDFWASWCAPCRKSLPWMEQMHEKYKDLGFTIIGVNMDGKKEVTEKFVKANNVTFTIARDPKGKIAAAYGVRGMPSSYLIGRDGNIHYSHEGFRNSDKARLEKIFKEALAQ